MGRVPDRRRGSRWIHLCFASTCEAATLLPTARSHSLRDSTPITVRWMLGRISMSSYPRSLRARMMHTPCAGASSTISCIRCSPSAISNEWEQLCISRRKCRGIQPLRTQMEIDDRRSGVCEDRERSTRLGRAPRMFWCSVFKIDGGFRRKLTTLKLQGLQRSPRRSLRLSQTPHLFLVPPQNVIDDLEEFVFSSHPCYTHLLSE